MKKPAEAGFYVLAETVEFILRSLIEGNAFDFDYVTGCVTSKMTPKIFGYGMGLGAATFCRMPR